MNFCLQFAWVLFALALGAVARKPMLVSFLIKGLRFICLYLFFLLALILISDLADYKSHDIHGKLCHEFYKIYYDYEIFIYLSHFDFGFCYISFYV